MSMNEVVRVSVGALQFLTNMVSTVLLTSVLITGCAYDSFHYPDEGQAGGHAVRAEVHRPPSNGIHKVKSGDTLFSIAFSYGLDYKKIARINDIHSPYVIYPNQKIRLTGSPKPSNSSSATLTKKSESPTVKVVTKSTSKKVNGGSKKAPAVNDRVKKVSGWRWPITGTVTKSFSNAGVSSKGIDIKGKYAEHVKAAADGVVVYAGDGLIGYGNLVIVKHDDVYLSAYAYNERILVKEKQSVRAGDPLAVIGGKGSERPLLHFEVRRDGRPMDPIEVLPTK